MPLFEPLYPARYAAPLLEFLRNAPAECLQVALAAAQIEEEVFRQPDYALTMTQVDALVCATSQQLGRTDLGFELGRRIKMDHHLGLVAMLRRCRSIDELLRMLCRFYRLVTPSFILHYQRSASTGEFTWRPAAYMSAATLRFFEEQYALAVHTEYLGMFHQRLPALDIYLSMEAPPHVARYAELHPTRVHFAALPMPAVRCVFKAEVLDLPLQWPELVAPLITGEVLTPHPETSAEELQVLHRKFVRTTRWGEWVALILREAEGCQPTREQIAELLSISPATLTRYLAAEGQSLRDMGKRIRHARACQLLADRQQSISQIAYRLGYGDVANFSHAFSKQAGQGPRRYRQALGASGEAGDSGDKPALPG
ncbi:helix-turn-helix domain-containing protein [Pseudomonas sp. N040]|uniref:helix-turn-helix domain-containing protein n=1 Tax=Pseudomonas sp. N040 TaxID=2785325 RepID=UPI0018A2C7E6|nr:AraC family transcriptional regulator [Pseudomonas sp. N040]MBF7728520.1 AraC family transcriptional regulator ligand-binding domain-containing protein [Pseudomonas sp. N040]MBW7012160.1 AraC family transcriptional regulator [Pseudomonas sp. N040]